MGVKYVLGLLCLIATSSAAAQHQVRGYVQTLVGEAVPYAHVVNTTRQRVTSSQHNGYFTIDAAEQDSLRFSIVGYQPYRMVVKPEHIARELKVVVMEDSILLPGITIFDRPMEPVVQAPDRKPMKVSGVRSKEEIEPRKPITFDMGNPGNGEGGVAIIGVGGSISGVFTYVYDLFSKDGKERRKYAESRKQSIEEAE